MLSIRNLLALSGATLLAACGGDTGVQTVGSVAPPASAGTPAPAATFVAPTEPKTYAGLGVVQHFAYQTDSNKTYQAGELYAGDANTVRDSGISLTYNPRDAIFELTISRPKGIVDVAAFRFQDPAHRTDFKNLARPQAGVPQFDDSDNIQYLEAGTGSGPTLDQSNPAAPYVAGSLQSNYTVGGKNYTSTRQTFFYQKPGTTTQYVTYAGFVRNTITGTEVQDDPSLPKYLRETYSFDRAAFVYGEQTPNSAVPRSGSADFHGDMIATLVFNDQIDFDPNAPTYFQWIDGTSGLNPANGVFGNTTHVDFGTLKVSSDFNGTVTAPALDAYTTGAFSLPAGWLFSAHSEATIDLINKGGFTGSFTSAKFSKPGFTDFTLNIAGSSVDGAFYGPNGEELGGGFRIVGGTPDQRIDILGVFTAKK